MYETDQTPETKRMTEVAEWLEKLQAAADDARKQVTVLHGQLRVVLRDEPEAEKKVDAPQALLVPLADKLRSLCEQVSETARMAKSASIRLEV